MKDQEYEKELREEGISQDHIDDIMEEEKELRRWRDEHDVW